MSVRLRWTGVQPETFMRGGVGEVEPGRSFPVSDEDAPSFLAHKNVELADPPAAESVGAESAEPDTAAQAPSKGRKTKTPTDTQPAPDAESTTPAGA